MINILNSYFYIRTLDVRLPGGSNPNNRVDAPNLASFKK